MPTSKTEYKDVLPGTVLAEVEVEDKTETQDSLEEELAEVHQKALIEFDQIQTSMKEERLQCLQDRRFYSITGAQWEGALGDQFENRPRFEVNKIHLAIMRIITDYRNNRISVSFVPKSGKENDDLTDKCAGLFRADEQDSCAEEAYDNAFEEAVGGGFGAFRLTTEYENPEDEDDERQRIRFRPIYDADSTVFFDLGAKRQDKADAKRCYVLTALPTQDYIDTYNDDPASWPKIIHQREFDWSTPSITYVCERYSIEETNEKVFDYADTSGEVTRYFEKDFEDDIGLEEKLLATGFKLEKEKNIKQRRVHKHLMSGSKILEDGGYIAGCNIPIVPTYGKRWVVDNVERCMGHGRLAKDIQRLKNMQISTLAEMAVSSGYEKPIFTPQQVAGHQAMWEADPVKKYPYLLINAITGPDGQTMVSGPVAYTKAPGIPPAMAALLAITDQDMREVLGNPQAGEQVVSNIASETMEMVQQRIDQQSFIYQSNMSKAIKRGGEIWLGMAKDVFVEEGRALKTVGASGEIESVKLLQPVVAKTGEVHYANDMAEAKFDVTVDIGPSSSSKRASVVRGMKELMGQVADSQSQQVLSAMIMMNMEGEGVQDVRDYYRKQLIKQGVIKPTDEESKDLQEELANMPPDPNAEYLKAAAEQANADAASKNATTILTIAKVEESKANALKTLDSIDASKLERLMTLLETLDTQGQQTPAVQPPMTNAQGWQLHKDSSGNLAYIGPNGEVEEVQNGL